MRFCRLNSFLNLTLCTIVQLIIRIIVLKYSNCFCEQKLISWDSRTWFCPAGGRRDSWKATGEGAACVTQQDVRRCGQNCIFMLVTSCLVVCTCVEACRRDGAYPVWNSGCEQVKDWEAGAERRELIGATWHVEGLIGGQFDLLVSFRIKWRQKRVTFKVCYTSSTVPPVASVASCLHRLWFEALLDVTMLWATIVGHRQY